MKEPKLSGFRIRALIGLTTALSRIGLYPTAKKLCQLPIEQRKAIKPAPWMTYTLPDLPPFKTLKITGQDEDLTLKVFSPNINDPAASTILFIHGGGWISGGVDSLDYLCANLCVNASTTVIAVDYRLAPEAPFPAGLNDCFDALNWVSINHHELGCANPDVIVIGDSAGGNLCAALCIHARAQKFKFIAKQILIYPALDATLQSPSMSFRNGGLTHSDITLMLEAYGGDTDLSNPLISPLLEQNLTGLPSALILTADCDPLRDDGKRYADRLNAIGAEVQHINYPGMPHGFLSLAKLCELAPKALRDISQFISTPLNSSQNNRTGQTSNGK